jgi:tetratricopeptide (TPR) repeat protein
MTGTFAPKVGFACLMCICCASYFAPRAAFGASASQANPQSEMNADQGVSANETGLERANALVATKQYEAAIRAYQDLLKSEPRNALYLNMIGICYLNLGNDKQAKKYFERSFKADKKYAPARSNLGMVWYRKKNYRRAIREYRKALAIDPDQAGVYANVGYAYYHWKKYKQAFAAFYMALEIDPNFFERTARVGTLMQDRTLSNHGMFYFMMAREYARLGDAPRCADALRKAWDEGYPEIAKARTDPDFAKVRDDPRVQEVLLQISPSLPAAPVSPRGK